MICLPSAVIVSHEFSWAVIDTTNAPGAGPWFTGAAAGGCAGVALALPATAADDSGAASFGVAEVAGAGDEGLLSAGAVTTAGLTGFSRDRKPQSAEPSATSSRGI